MHEPGREVSRSRSRWTPKLVVCAQLMTKQEVDSESLTGDQNQGDPNIGVPVPERTTEWNKKSEKTT